MDVLRLIFEHPFWVTLWLFIVTPYNTIRIALGEHAARGKAKP
jgi:hypothetical protein